MKQDKQLIDAAAKYYLINFQRDFIMNKKINFVFDEPTKQQQRFDSFIRSKGIVLIDYQRTLKEPKYFTILSKYLEYSKENKKSLLYVRITNSYISPTCEFYGYTIPKNATEKNFQNIYNYLFVDNKRECCFCGIDYPYYFCTDCGVYYCRECLYENLKYFIDRDIEYQYVVCCCGKWNIIYKLPSRYDV